MTDTIDVHNTRMKGLIICAGAYAAALTAGVGILILMKGYHPLVTALAADIAATIVIFIVSMAVNNSSIYDPYWSIAPVPIALYFAQAAYTGNAAQLRQLLVVGLILAWGARLTANWVTNWKGLAHEDWRYVEMREKSGRWYWPVSFLGIHLFPTLIVYLGLLSVYISLGTGIKAFGILDIIALIVTGGAILIEALADRQLHAFIDSSPGKGAIISQGLWKYSRHPNYFGEVSFWWGLFIFSIAAGGFQWWALIGPVSITLMFLFVSIPWMDRRSCERRPGFDKRMKEVSALVPWFPRKRKGAE